MEETMRVFTITELVRLSRI
jgi:hypothetical protein